VSPEEILQLLSHSHTNLLCLVNLAPNQQKNLHANKLDLHKQNHIFHCIFREVVIFGCNIFFAHKDVTSFKYIYTGLLLCNDLILDNGGWFLYVRQINSRPV